MEKIALITLGCAKNLVDSEVMLGYLGEAGYGFVPTPEEAEVILVNTCGFIQPAKEEASSVLQKALDLKKKRKDIKIIGIGCYVERYGDALREKYPEVDVWLGIKDFHNIVQVVQGKPFEPAKECFLYDHTSPRIISTPPSWAYIKISEGCSHQCSFCAIPMIKGIYKSRTIDSILQEAEGLVAKGAKEINLISQDTTYFGRDRGLKDGLTQLLKGLLEIRKAEWIRILYGYPEEVSGSLLEIMQEERICSYLDLPFQHSDPQIIKRMKRGMDGQKALTLIHKIRQKLPDISLRTSLVVGFPGEGKKEFENLMNFIQEVRFDHLGVFTYSHEEGTSCFDLGDPVSERVKERRKRRLMELQAEVSFQNHQRYLKKRIDVLVEGTLKENSSQLVGRAKFQAPEVDGIIFLDSPYPLDKIVNSIQKVEITAHDIYDLYGEVT